MLFCSKSVYTIISIYKNYSNLLKGGIMIKLSSIINFIRDKYYPKRYNLDKPNDSKKGGKTVTAVLEKLHNVKLTSKQKKDLCVGDNWKEQIQPEFVEKVIENAEKYRKALKELAKH